MAIFTPAKGKEILKEVLEAAGPRYTPEINLELPISDLFNGIGRTDEFFFKIKELQEKNVKAFRSVNRSNSDNYQEPVVKQNLLRIQTYGSQFIELINQQGKNPTHQLDLNAIQSLANKIEKYFQPINSTIWDIEKQEDEDQKEKAEKEKREYLGHNPSENLKKLQGLQSNLRDFQRTISSVSYFFRSYEARLFNEPFLLILGQAGMGKTHLVCDIAKQRNEKEAPPTIIVLGETLLNINDPFKAIFKACSLKGGKREILRELNRLGKAKKQRSLIIVDAINEADRKGWKASIRSLIKELKKYPWIGLVMTCRIPFEHLSLPRRLRIITEYHTGFSENEIEAMVKFFNHYNIPLPEVPLLISEFNHPLFLSCFCKTAKSIKNGEAKVAKGLKDLALGQVGMTKILEDFYDSKEVESIKKNMTRFPQIIKKGWLWSGENCLIKMMANEMATNGKDYIYKGKMLDIIKQLSSPKLRKSECLKILNILIEDAAVIRDATWDENTKAYVDVIKFPFHKFSDHIIARYLLSQFFDSNRARLSLSAKNPLGILFSTEENVLENISIIEALMVELDSRIKRNSKLNNKDLIDYLPTSSRSHSSVRTAFVQSLYWRKPDTMLNKEGEIRKSILNYINSTLLRYKNSSELFLDLFVSTATKPKHPLNAKRLNQYLERFNVSDRDLRWTEYLRSQESSGSVYRLITWIEEQDMSQVTNEQAWCLITTLGWTLTSNVTLLRNRATRCIYIIGKIKPEYCFKAMLKLLAANDPYVIERILAAGFGIGMALHHTANKLFLKNYLQFARKIYSLFFKKKAPLATTNILIRDNARGIIELALTHKENLLTKNQIERIRPPYKDGGRRRWGRSKDKDEGKYRDGNAPLGMDFENYTLGHLVPNRRNYDYQHKGFNAIKEKVLWRIYQLGYSLEDFGKIDQNIKASSRHSRVQYPNKVDRYGKKYSWIAYYELLGLKLDKGDYEKWYGTPDGRSEEYSIDPSFPELGQGNFLFNDNLSDGPRGMKAWMTQKEPPNISKYLQLDSINGIQGPWVLIHGTIGHLRRKQSKRITTFINGILADEKYEPELKRVINTTPFLGNSFIPSLPDVRTEFLGELGWRAEYKESRLTIDMKRGEKKIKLTKKERESYKFQTILADMMGKKAEKKEVPNYRTVPIYEKIPVKPLARWMSSQDYSKLGSENGVGMYLPSAWLLKNLKLNNGAGSFNFVDTKNKVATISIAVGEEYGTTENLMYLRQDLVDKICKRAGKSLFQITWGERQYWPEETEKIHARKDLQPIYQVHRNIYKKVYKY